MTSGEHKKGSASNGSWWWHPVCLYHKCYQDLLYHTKGFQIAGHYSNLKYWKQNNWLYSRGWSSLVNSLDSEEGNEMNFQYLRHNCILDEECPEYCTLNFLTAFWNVSKVEQHIYSLHNFSFWLNEDLN